MNDKHRIILAGAWSALIATAAMQFTADNAQRAAVLVLAFAPLAVILAYMKK